MRESKIHGRGLFAIADIAKNEIVAVKGGHIVDRKTLREKITPLLGPVEIQIDDDLFIAPVTDEERELSMLYSNHSCDPNLGVRGEITFVAMRDICTGEELTHDWAMTDDDDYSIECNCGAPDCRKTLTGKDWQRPDLQKRYAGYFSAYLARKIALLKSAAVDAVREEFRFSRYEKALINLGYRRGRSGRNGWLRPDKEAGGSGEGGAGRCAFRSSRLGHAVSRRAVHAADHV